MLLGLQILRYDVRGAMVDAQTSFCFCSFYPDVREYVEPSSPLMSLMLVELGSLNLSFIGQHNVDF